VQFEVFQSVVNPDKLAILERWTDQIALDARARIAPPPFRPELPAGNTNAKTTRITGPCNPDFEGRG
jgi:hypothetical protein